MTITEPDAMDLETPADPEAPNWAALLAIGRFLVNLYDRVARESIIVFGLVPLYLIAFQEQLIDSDAEKAWWTGVVVALQRLTSTSKRAANEREQSAAYVGAIEHQNLQEAGKAVAAQSEAKAATRALTRRR